MKGSMITKSENEYIISARKTDFAYVGFLLCLFVLLAEFFYRQTIRYNDAYISDTIVYAQNLGKLNGSRMIAWLFPKLHAINGGTFEIAVFMSLVVIATIIANYFLIDYLLQREKCSVERWKIQALSLIGLFSSAIYVPGIYEHFYMKTWPRYAWHSPTQQSMVLFSVISLILFLKIYDHYFERIRFSQWLGLTASIFLATWSKPNFMMILAPTAVIVFIADLVSRREYSLWHRIKRIVMLGCTMIPAGLFMIGISMYEYGEDGASEGVGIMVGYFLRNIDHPAVMIFLSLAFPLVVIAFNLRKLKDRAYQIICSMTAFGIAEYLTLVELGKTINHGNFGWGREVGEYILFLAALSMAVMNYKDPDFLSGKPVVRKLYFLLIGLLLAGHVLSQLWYFQLLIRGHLYRM